MRQLFFDSKNPYGIFVEVANTFEPIPYEQRVVNRIRSVYSVDDELAILRQRDTKPEEFEQYNDFVELIKEEERAVT